MPRWKSTVIKTQWLRPSALQQETEGAPRHPRQCLRECQKSSVRPQNRGGQGRLVKEIREIKRRDAAPSELGGRYLCHAGVSTLGH